MPGCICESPSRSATRTEEFAASRSKVPSNLESSSTNARLSDVLTCTFSKEESTVASWRRTSVLGKLSIRVHVSRFFYLSKTHMGLSSPIICASYSGVKPGLDCDISRLKSEEFPELAAKLTVAEKGLIIECQAQASAVRKRNTACPLEDFMNKVVGPARSLPSVIFVSIVLRDGDQRRITNSHRRRLTLSSFVVLMTSGRHNFL